MLRLWERVRNLFLLTLFFMILFRIVWLQLRVYDVIFPGVAPIEAYQWFCSPLVQGKFQPLVDWICSLSWIEGGVINWNLKVFFLTIAVMMLGVRILLGSWMFAMVGACVVLSRGSLTSMMGIATPDGVLMLAIMVWVTLCCHLSKSASNVLLIGGILLITLGSIVEITLISLCAVPFLFLLFSYSKNIKQKKMTSGGVFRRLEVRLSVYALQNKVIKITSFLFFLCPLGFFMWQSLPMQKSVSFESIWMSKSLDVHFLMSVVIMLWVSMSHPDSTVRESIRLMLISCVVLIFSCLCTEILVGFTAKERQWLIKKYRDNE